MGTNNSTHLIVCTEDSVRRPSKGQGSELLKKCELLIGGITLMMAMVVVFTWAQGFPYLLESTKVLRRNRSFFSFHLLVNNIKQKMV